MRNLLQAALSLLRPGSDEESMLRVKAYNDHAAFDRLVNRWELPIWRLCARMVGDPHRGEDLAQETFKKVFENRGTYESTARFSTYLWRIAVNVCRDELRRQERRRDFLIETPLEQNGAVEDEQTAPEDLQPDVGAARQEEGELVRRALQQLPEIYRTVLVLRHYEGMKLARIAAVLEIPEGTVNSRMAEALGRLCRILQPKLQIEGSRSPGRCRPTGEREGLLRQTREQGQDSESTQGTTAKVHTTAPGPLVKGTVLL